MGMCATGSLAIISAPQGGCSSINTALGSPAIYDLKSLSIFAGKTAPYSEISFHSFCRETSYKAIGFSNITAAGTNGTASRCTTDCICSNSAMVAGQCYTIALCHNMCSNTCTGSFSTICVCCNSGQLYCCHIANTCTGAHTFSCSFVVTATDTICIMQCAVHSAAGGSCCSCAMSCITSITPTLGLFCETAGCSCCCVYSCL